LKYGLSIRVESNVTGTGDKGYKAVRSFVIMIFSSGINKAASPHNPAPPKLVVKSAPII